MNMTDLFLTQLDREAARFEIHLVSLDAARVGSALKVDVAKVEALGFTGQRQSTLSD